MVWKIFFQKCVDSNRFKDKLFSEFVRLAFRVDSNMDYECFITSTPNMDGI